MKPMHNARSILILVAALAVAGMGSCRSKKTNTSFLDSEHTEARKGKEGDPYEAHGANIRIVPRADGPGRPLILSFCYEQGDAYDPQIWRVRIGPVSGQKTSCTFSAVEGAYLWNQWQVGIPVPGFTMAGCGPLSPGEYEVYAYGRVGDGVLRMSLERDGSVRVVPWDKFTAVNPSACPRADGRKPRFLTVEQAAGSRDR